MHDYLGLMQIRMGAAPGLRAGAAGAAGAAPGAGAAAAAAGGKRIRHGLEPKVEGGRIDGQRRRATVRAWC